MNEINDNISGNSGIERDYEVSFLVPDENDVEDIVKLINSYKAEILFESEIKKIALAYPIKKEKEAYFGYFHFRMSPDGISSFNSELKMNPKVIRHLIVTPPITKEYAKRKKKKPKDLKNKKVKPAKLDDKSLPLSNEALEKKIEEILNE